MSKTKAAMMEESIKEICFACEEGELLWSGEITELEGWSFEGHPIECTYDIYICSHCGKEFRW